MTFATVVSDTKSAFATTGQHDVSGIRNLGATESAFSNGSCGYLESEIVTPDGAQPSVLLNDGLDPGVEYAAELVSALRRRRFELGWDGSFEYEGPLRRHSPTGSGVGRIRRPCIDLGHDIGSIGARVIDREGQRFRLVVRCRDQALERIGMVFRRDPPLLQADGLRSNPRLSAQT